jgi:hypothetical protein
MTKNIQENHAYIKYTKGNIKGITYAFSGNQLHRKQWFKYVAICRKIIQRKPKQVHSCSIIRSNHVLVSEKNYCTCCAGLRLKGSTLTCSKEEEQMQRNFKSARGTKEISRHAVVAGKRINRRQWCPKSHQGTYICKLIV